MLRSSKFLLNAGFALLIGGNYLYAMNSDGSDKSESGSVGSSTPYNSDLDNEPFVSTRNYNFSKAAYEALQAVNTQNSSKVNSIDVALQTDNVCNSCRDTQTIACQTDSLSDKISDQNMGQLSAGPSNASRTTEQNNREKELHILKEKISTEALAEVGGSKDAIIYPTEVNITQCDKETTHDTISSVAYVQSNTFAKSNKTWAQRINWSKPTNPIKQEQIPFEDMVGIYPSIVGSLSKKIKSINLDHADQLGKFGNRILFYGPRGNGKTQVAKNIASYAHSAYIHYTGADLFSNGIKGSGVCSINYMFAYARRLAQYTNKMVVIIIDEIDLAAEESVSQDSQDISRRVAAKLWTSLDEPINKNILLIGTTNYKERLSPGLLSRFSKKKRVEFPNPDSVMISEIFQHYFKQIGKDGIAPDLLKKLVKKSTENSLSIREIEQFVTEDLYEVIINMQRAGLEPTEDTVIDEFETFLTECKTERADEARNNALKPTPITAGQRILQKLEDHSLSFIFGFASFAATNAYSRWMYSEADMKRSLIISLGTTVGMELLVRKPGDIFGDVYQPGFATAITSDYRIVKNEDNQGIRLEKRK